jgi:hypothetical protein
MKQIESVVAESARARWSRIIEQQRESGLAVAVFCRERSLAVSSYYGWRRKLAGSGESTTRFIEARVVDEGCDSIPVGTSDATAVGMRIELACGRRVVVERGFDRRLLLDLLAVLEGKS